MLSFQFSKLVITQSLHTLNKAILRHFQTVSPINLILVSKRFIYQNRALKCVFYSLLPYLLNNQ